MHVWPSIWCLRRKNTAAGGEPAGAHNPRLSRQIGELLLRAICLSCQIVEAVEKSNRTTLPTDSHTAFSLRCGAGSVCSRLRSKSGQVAVVGPGERLRAGDVVQQHPDPWTVRSLPAKGYPLFVPRAGGSQLGHASVNSELDLNAQRGECCELSWRIFLQTESVIVLMCHWWDKCATVDRIRRHITLEQCTACCNLERAQFDGSCADVKV